MALSDQFAPNKTAYINLSPISPVSGGKDKMIAEITLSSIVSIVISKDKGDDNQSFRIITLVDKDGKEHTVNVFGVFGGELPISL
jgi:hypothetical protein